MTRPRLYLAMPYSAPTRDGIEANVRRACEVAAELTGLGYAVLCPHSNSHYVAGLPGAPEHTSEDWYEIDLAWLDVAEIVYGGPGWSDSKGATAEVLRAKARGIPVVCHPHPCPAPGEVWDLLLKEQQPAPDSERETE